MLNKSILTEVLKATIKTIIVAFIFTCLFLSITYFLFSKNIKKITSMVDLISIKTSNTILEDVTIDLESKNLNSYPAFGSKYADMIIPSLNLNLPVYFGDTLTILRKGIGHSSGSYFPGEGGSVLYMGHNNDRTLKTLTNINIGDTIEVHTTYGEFTYEVFNTKVIFYKDLDEIPIQRDEEILILYTCYQNLTIGHTPKRFVVYANLIKKDFK